MIEHLIATIPLSIGAVKPISPFARRPHLALLTDWIEKIGIATHSQPRAGLTGFRRHDTVAGIRGREGEKRVARLDCDDCGAESLKAHPSTMIGSSAHVHDQ